MDITEIVKACKQGSKEAWPMIINAYSKTVYNIALNFIGDKDEAADITQDIFIKLYHNIDKFKDERNFSSWLLTLSRNYCIDYWRKNKKYRQASPIDEHISDDGANPEETLVKNSEISYLRRQLLELDPELRIFITMRDIQNKSYQEISEEFDIPLGTVKSRINRARIKLSQLLAARSA